MTRLLAAALLAVLGGFTVYGMYCAVQDVALRLQEREMRELLG